MTASNDIDETVATIDTARALLKSFGFDAQRYNVRSGVTLLALAGLKPGDRWADSTTPRLGVQKIMDWSGEHWAKPYATGSREDFRKKTLRQWVDTGFAVLNPDNQNIATNSQLNEYCLSDEAVGAVRSYGTDAFENALVSFLNEASEAVKARAEALHAAMISVDLPDREAFLLSPSGQNPLLKKMVEEFVPRFAPDAKVLYLGDTRGKQSLFEDRIFEETLGLAFDPHGRMPDLVLYDEARGWLFLMEAVKSKGPFDDERHRSLRELFATPVAGLVFVNCFENREAMRQWLPELAWETEAWVADDPDHLIHLNGLRFLGPYER
ncbi:BsuBI/PstI family type II restriction endonuclease [Nonomuraea diastatica]|uniref:Restriction endonuclease n=1 Tax=Nonomuraea diastatica TaxID=1848329 RepID=A0A4R4WT05_9ACTN|nr:BsuBI/PstI family type II restriction endonuclease [Nonomuraea diastatica]TDD20743.1 restriction endonuclease [Nonomuraea diastatica]